MYNEPEECEHEPKCLLPETHSYRKGFARGRTEAQKELFEWFKQTINELHYPCFICNTVREGTGIVPTENICPFYADWLGKFDVKKKELGVE